MILWPMTVDGRSPNDFVGCVVFIYIFWHLIDYNFFVSFGYLNVRGTRDVFVVWRVVTGAALALGVWRLVISCLF